MIQKLTILNVADNTGFKWLKTIHLYNGFKKKFSKPGNIIKGVGKKINVFRKKVLKIKKIKKFKKKTIKKSLFIRQTFNCYKNDHFFYKFKQNSTLIFKKKNFKSKFIKGPGTSLIRKKRFFLNFKKII